MNIPNLPTDNLYKFLALAGLVLLASSIALPLWTQRELELEIARVSSEIDVRRTELTYLTSEIEAFYGDLEIPQSEWPSLPSEFPELVGKIRQAGDDRAHRDKAARYLERGLALEQALAEVELGTRQVDALEAYSSFVNTFSWFGLVGGLGLSALGFALWYMKVQRHQDSLLEAQSRKERSGS